MKAEELIEQAKLFFDTYKKEIGNCIRKGRKVVFVNFEDLSSTSPILAEALVSSPEEILKLLETALEETGLIKNPKIRFISLPETQKIKIRTIRVKNINQIIFFEGIIKKVSEIYPIIVLAKFECPSCGTIISVLQIERKFREPSRCQCGRRGPFRLISKVMVDAQKIIVEEIPENLFVGDEPRSIEVFLKEDLTSPQIEEKTIPGSRVKIFGILKEVPILIQSSISTRFNLIVDANNIIHLESESTTTPKSGDFGVDVIAVKDGEKTGIQCKLFGKNVKIDTQTVQKAIGSVRSPYKANKLIFVTTAIDFTSSAKEQIEGYDIPVELWNREKLIAEIASHMHDLEDGWRLLNKLEEKEMYCEEKEIPNFDIDRFTTETPSKLRGKIFLVKDAIKKLTETHGNQISKEDVKKEVGENFTSLEFDDAIRELIHKSDIFEPKAGFVQSM
jgi:DNA replicative helicase MCM subunit Mcm2 (Cdc46/Mcm family)